MRSSDIKSADDLKKTLFRIHDKGYKAYQDIEGLYLFQYELSVDRVRADPYAPPSRVRAIVSLKKWRIFSDLWENETRRIALRFYRPSGPPGHPSSFFQTPGYREERQINIETGGPGDPGTVGGGDPGRNLELRLTVGLPAAGRTVLGMDAVSIFFEDLPKVVQQGVFQFPNLGLEVKHFVNAYEDPGMAEIGS